MLIKEMSSEIPACVALASDGGRFSDNPEAISVI